MDQKNQDKIMGLNAIILHIMVIVRLSLFVEAQIYFICVALDLLSML